MLNENYIQILREADIKPTTQRVTILAYLLQHKTHPSSEKIYQDLQSEVSVMSRATVYNTVNVFKEKGLLKVLETGDEFLHYDIETKEHAHFKCKVCGKIWNIDLPENMPALLNLPEGFSVDGTEVLIKGTCSDCK